MIPPGVSELSEEPTLAGLSWGGTAGNGNHSCRPINPINGGSELTSPSCFLKRQKVQLTGLTVSSALPDEKSFHFFSPRRSPIPCCKSSHWWQVRGPTPSRLCLQVPPPSPRHLLLLLSPDGGGGDILSPTALLSPPLLCVLQTPTPAILTLTFIPQSQLSLCVYV